MTDLAAIRARHVESKVKGVVGYTVCYAEGTDWPCDTAIVLAALDDTVNWDLYGQLQAAEAREARLRAALSRVTDVPLTDVDDWLAAYEGQPKEPIPAWDYETEGMGGT